LLVISISAGVPAPLHRTARAISLSFVCPHGPAYARDLHSFPTRRSSDLGIRTLPWRIRAQSANAARLAGYLASHPAIEAVHYPGDRKSTRLNSSHQIISYAVFCLKKKKQYGIDDQAIQRRDEKCGTSRSP